MHNLAGELRQMPNDEHEAPTVTAPGKCLYCGYDLSGLPDDAHCPECGRQSIPAAFRREVQDIFDSPLRLYREALRVIGKHPPGWYWSLDRPRDVARSFRLAMINVLLCILIVFAAWMAANALVLRVVDEIVFVDPGGVRPTLLAYRSTSLYGAMGLSIHLDDEYLSSPDQIKSRAAGLVRRHLRTQEAASHGWCLEHWHGCAIVSTLVVMIWVILTQLGMWTQIRRGLPAFARARRTIMAAANCESCKLPFQALVVALGLAAETAVRLALPDPQLRSHTVLLSVLIPFMVGLILASWISPLRSDFTRQLIGSRGHAVRMYVMYVLIFPLPLSGIIMGLIFSLTSGQLVF